MKYKIFPEIVDGLGRLHCKNGGKNPANHFPKTATKIALYLISLSSFNYLQSIIVQIYLMENSRNKKISIYFSLINFIHKFQ
jgi:hypothetical protein